MTGTERYDTGSHNAGREMNDACSKNTGGAEYLFDWSLPLNCPALARRLRVPAYFLHGDYLKATECVVPLRVLCQRAIPVLGCLQIGATRAPRPLTGLKSFRT